MRGFLVSRGQDLVHHGRIASLPDRRMREPCAMVLLVRMTELQKLLARAAELSAEQGLATDDFMTAAWNAHLDANPAMRDELIERELRAQLKRLRRQGMVPQA